MGPSLDNSMPDLSDLWKLSDEAIGVGLPLNDLERAKAIIKQGVDYHRTKGGPRFFFTSHGPVSHDVDFPTLHQIIKEIRQVCL